MRRRTVLASMLVLLVQLLLSAAVAPAEPVSAQTPPKNGSAQQVDKQAQAREFKARLKVSQAEREAAADRARARGLKLPPASGGRLGAATVPGGTQAPHYFGPYPNYANSPLATVTTTTSTGGLVGNPLVARTYATEIATPPGVAGPVFAVVPTPGSPCGNAPGLSGLQSGIARGKPYTLGGEAVSCLPAAAHGRGQPVHRCL